MSRVVALGERSLVEGFGLAGAEVLVVADADQARAAWDALGGDVAVVIVTPEVHQVLVASAGLPEVGPGRPLLVVLGS